MRISDIMTKNPTYITPDISVQTAARMMSMLNCGALLIAEDERLCGIITDRDIALRCVAEGRNISDTSVRDVMTHKVLYCFADETPEAVADNMYRNNIVRLAVLDRNKRLCGVITHGDIARGAAMWNLQGRMLGSKVNMLAAQSVRETVKTMHTA